MTDPFGSKISADILERRIELVETDDCTSLNTTVTRFCVGSSATRLGHF